MEVKHVSETAVCQGGTEYGDIVLVCPVINGFLVVDFFAKSVDYFARCPVDGFIRGF